MSKKQYEFDYSLAKECIEAFSVSTGLDTAIVALDGEILLRCGDCGMSCPLEEYASKVLGDDCRKIHLYGMMQAERFGGKYIYFCPCGYNFMVSPIYGSESAVAYIKAGPFLMVEYEDYIKEDLLGNLKVEEEKIDKIKPSVESIPYIAPDKVTKFSNLLFMAIGFINNIQQYNNLIKMRDSTEMQGHIGSIVSSLKGDEENGKSAYPYATEKELVNAIADGDKPLAARLLNEILGYIFFYSGGDFQIIHANVIELIVLLSRAAIDGGADADYIAKINRQFINETRTINNVDQLCIWLADVVTKYIDQVFDFNEIKHIDVMRKAIDFIRRNYNKRITLEEVAQMVYLSPSYFSKLFKDEIGVTFNTYLNNVRIEKSKHLLLDNSVKLVDISGLVGFEDQSYFSKVFKNKTSMSPGQYRKSRGKIKK